MGNETLQSIYEIFGEPISVYTRRQALADGTLVDVSDMAREAGVTFPVAITSGLHADIHDIPEEHSYQSYTGRLWDVLHMFGCAVKGLIPKDGDDECMIYELIMHIEGDKRYFVKAVCGRGDEAEPVITLMRESES
jgi:hypothetical protein